MGGAGADAQRKIELARTALAAGNDGAAVDAYMDVLREYPSHYEALFEAGKALFRRGDAEAGRVLFSRLIESARHDAKALFDIGTAAWELGRPVEAHAALSLAIAGFDALNPRDAEAAKRMLGKIYSDWSVMGAVMQAADLDADDGMLSRQIESHPGDAVFRALRGFVREKRYRLYDAIADFAEAQSIGLADLELRPLVQKARIDMERFEHVAKEGGHDAAAEFRYFDINDAIRLFDRKSDWNGLERYLDALSGRRDVGAFAAVQLGYLRAARGNLDGAEECFDFAFNADAGGGAFADIERGRALVAAFRSGAANFLGDLAAQPSIAKDMPVLPWLHISDKLRLAERLMGRQAFSALGVVLDQLAAMPLNDGEKGRYLVCLGESVWAEGKEDEAVAIFRAAEKLPIKDSRLAHALYRFARHYGKKGNLPLALSYAQKSIDLTAGYDWAHIRIGTLFITLKQYEKGIAHFERALLLAETPEEKCNACKAVAEAYSAMGDRERYLEWAEKYIGHAADIVSPVSARYAGNVEFYRGEMQLAAGETEAAYASYERAAQLVVEPNQLAKIHMVLAEAREKEGKIELAAEHARLSADLLPHQRWKQQQVGALLVKLGMAEEGAEYIERALVLQPSAREALAGFRDLAERFRRRGDGERYLRYAHQYVERVSAAGGEATSDEAGMGAFYRGEIAAAGGAVEDALAAYEKATQLLADPAALSDAFMKMAECAAALNDGDRAVELARRSVGLAPERSGRTREAAAIVKRFSDGEASGAGGAAVAAEPKRDAVLRDFAALADAARQDGDGEGFLANARLYVDAADSRGEGVSSEERGLGELYRGELLLAEGDGDNAYAAFERAARLVTDKYRLAEAYMKMAEYNAGAGRVDLAAAQAELSAEQLPDRIWKSREAGNFLMAHGRAERAEEYFEKAVAAASTPGEKLAVYDMLAEAFGARGEREKYFAYARRYIEALESGGYVPARGEEGVAAFYKGELFAADGEDDNAYEAYERAAPLLENRYRRSEAYAKMAEHLFANGERGRAAEAIERSVELLPEQAGKLRQAGGFFARLAMAEKAAEYFEQALALAKTAGEKAAAHLALAEQWKAGDGEQYRSHVEKYLEALGETGELSGDAVGLGLYYRGELFRLGGKPDAALGEYEQAVGLLKNDARRAEAYMRIAELHRERGNRELAARAAEQSLAVFPDQIRKLKEVGAFFGLLEMGDRELRLYRRALSLAANPKEEASVLQAVADFYRGRKDRDLYLAYAEKYVDAVARIGDSAGGDELGLAEYFRGERHFGNGEKAEAYAAYARAAELLTEKYRRSEALFKMAEYSADAGDKERALAEGLESAALLPDKRWRAAGVAGVFGSLGKYWDAADVLNTAIGMNPAENGALYKNLADVHIRGIDKKAGMGYNAHYIDLLVEQMALDGYAVADDPYEEWWNARRRQTNWAKSWGKFEGRVFGSRDADGDYYLATNNELYFNTRFPNGFRGKIYGEFGWTLLSKHTGYSLSRRDGSVHPWESNPGMEETFRALVGFRFSPFRKIGALDFRTEYVFGIGREEESDFRFRLKFDCSSGLNPRIFGRFWQYAKEEAEVIYSTRGNDVTSLGTIRRGFVFSPYRDRDLLLAPYWSLRYNYGGREEDKGERWSFQTGPGLVMRKYFWEDDHHAARAYFELNLHFRIGLTKGRQNALGFTMTTAF